jgi:hypothetical protein
MVEKRTRSILFIHLLYSIKDNRREIKEVKNDYTLYRLKLAALHKE